MLTLALALALAVNTVLLPEDSKLTRQELERRNPGVQVVSYAGQTTVALPTDGVLVLYIKERKDVPARYAKGHNFAVALYEKRRVYVFLPVMEDYLKLQRTSPFFRIALGRVLSHELEHIRRQSGDHDETGWFTACVGRDWLTDLSR